MQTADDCEIAVGQEALLPVWTPTRDAAIPPVGLVGVTGCRSPGCSFLHLALLRRLETSPLGSLMLKGLCWRWMDPSHCFREVLKTGFGSTMSDGLRPPEELF